MDFEGFEKQSKNVLSALRDMQNGLSRNMQSLSKMEGSEEVMKKMDSLNAFMKAGDLSGIMGIQDDILKMKKDIQDNGGTDNSN